jgi:RNA polymerase sigma factor (TIGR02999 family)
MRLHRTFQSPFRKLLRLSAIVNAKRVIMDFPGKHLSVGRTGAKKLSLDAVLPQIYDELHRMAAVYMRRERDGHTLQPTALVNETYMRLVGQHSVNFDNRAQVLGIAAQMMRRILRTYDEQRRAEKRGGDQTILCLDDSQEPSGIPQLFFGEVDELLERLATLDARQAKVAELRIFGGLTSEEVGEFLGVSTASAHRYWASGRLWLARELRANSPVHEETTQDPRV